METYLLFLWESTLWVLHIELGKVKSSCHLYFPRDLGECFCHSCFQWRHSLNLCLVYYCPMGLLVVVFLIWLFWKPFKRPTMNSIALFILFGRAGSFYPAKWKSYLGKHSIDRHIFLRSVICCREARAVRARQKSHWECINTEMCTASFCITGDAEGKYSKGITQIIFLFIYHFMFSQTELSDRKENSNGEFSTC